MKYIFFVISFFFIKLSFGQVPQKLSYQAIIRDDLNNLVSIKNIGMRVSIIQGDINNIPIYIETHNSKTNINGLISIQIGAGNKVFGSFTNIDWSKGPTFVLTETDPDGGTNYTISGHSELLSVPYALFSANSNGNLDTTSLSRRIDSKQNTLVLGRGVQTFLSTPTSLNLQNAVTDKTGFGNLVFSNNPTLINPILGEALATSIISNTLTLTTPLSIANGGIGTTTVPQNFVFAGPLSGSGAPSFRRLDTSDLPILGRSTYGVTLTSFTPLSLTKIGNSGPSTYTPITRVLNIPEYTLTGLGGISLSSLSASAPLEYNNTNGVFSMNQSNAFTNGYLSSTDWNTFFNKQGALTLTTTGNSGSATLVGNTLNIPQYQGFGASYAFSSPLVNTSGIVSIPVASSTTNGYLSSADWNTFNNKVSISALSNYVPFNRQITINGVSYDLSADRSWNISAGVSSIYGRTGSVTAQTGDYNTSQVNEGSNFYFTNERARLALSLTTTGTSGPATYDNTTGILNIPQYQGGVTSFNNRTGTITLSGTDVTTALGYTPYNVTNPNNFISLNSLSGGSGISYNSITGVVSSSITQYTDAMAKSAIALTTSGNSGSSTYSSTTGVLNIPEYTLTGLGGIGLSSLSGTAPLSYNNTNGTFSMQQANSTTSGYLSSTDWNIFNNKQTTLTNPLTGTGTTNYLAKWTGTSTHGNSIIQDDGNNHIAIGYSTNPSSYMFDVNGTGNFSGNLSTSRSMVIGYNSPLATLQVNQLAGTSKGIFISGDEYYSSGNGTNIDGVRLALGVSRGGNRQLWIGDNAAYGSANKGLFRYQTGQIGYVGLDATSGDGLSRLLTILGTESSNIGVGYDALSPNYTLYTGKLNSFVYNQNIPNLNLRQFGTGISNFLQNINVSGNIISGFNSNGYLFLNGTSTGTVTIQPQSNSGSYSITLPSSAGSSDQIIKTDGIGNLSWQTLNTSVVPELTNLYYTDTRSRNALSFASGVGSYSSTTGIITIPTSTSDLTNGANYITLGSLTGGTGISYNSNTGVISSTITQYTDANARSSISLTTTGNAGSSSYSPTTGILNIPNYTLTGLGGEPTISTGSNLQYWRGDKTWQTLNTSVVPELTNLYYTDTRSRNALSFASGVGSYSSTTGIITIPTSTSDLTNGANYITLGSLSGTAPISYNNSTGAFSISQASTTTNGYLSSTDWNTFNGKQNTLTNPITGTGTTNYLSKFTASSTTGNSIIYDNGSNIGIGKSSPTANLDILQTSTNKNGIRITGAEYYQPSNNDPNNGIAIVLGVNRSQNRQVWIGSSEVMGSSTLGLLRFQTGTTIPNIDATTGDGASRLNMGLGTATTNVLIGTPDGNSTIPGSSLSVARNLSVGSSYWSTSAPTNGAIIQGNVGIGNSSPVALLALGTSGSISGSLSLAGSSSGTVFIQPKSAAGSYTLSLPSSAGNAGQLLTTDGSGILSWTSALPLTGGTITGNLNFWQTSDYDAVNFYTGGTQTIAGKISVSSGNSVSYNTTSDYRLKQDFKQFNALSLVDSIRVYDFQWKSDKSRSYGVKAHELKSVIPYVVQGEKDDINEDGTINPQSVDYSKIVPVLIKAIQELNIKVENFEKANLELRKIKNKKK